MKLLIVMPNSLLSYFFYCRIYQSQRIASLRECPGYDGRRVSSVNTSSLR